MKVKSCNALLKGKRPLKVYQSHLKKGWVYDPVPEIRLKGKWVEELGFKSGENISVFVSQERILITKGQVVTIVL